jgi:peroxiredoxin Q/BCP
MRIMTLHMNDRAPAFALYDSRHQLVHLSDFKGKYVVLYFYPKDDTPGCTKEACDFRDYAEEFSSLNVVILGVSKDTEDSHVHFSQKYGLPFVLLADPAGDVLNKYGVWKEKSFMGKTNLGTVRSTFLINPHGTIARIYDDVKVYGHVAGVLEDVKELAQGVKR